MTKTWFFRGDVKVFLHSPVEEMFQLSGYVCSETLCDLELIPIMFMSDGDQSVTHKKKMKGFQQQ